MIREIVESKAREAAEEMMSAPNTIWPESLGGTIHYDTRKIAKHFESAIIAILTDPQVGFKEALGLAHHNRFLCQNCRRSLWDKACPEYCPCPCHTAEAKLEELKELEKVK